jgi:hypothetical protein
MALRPTARRFGFEVSWPNVLIRQDPSPFGLCLTLGLQWRLVIQDFFGARNVARLSSCQRASKQETLVNGVLIWGSTQTFVGLTKRFQGFSAIAKKDHSKYLKRSFSIADSMASGDTCPQGTSNARYVATLAGLEPSLPHSTTAGEHGQNAPTKELPTNSAEKT